jgi:hypothetical protein
VSLDLVKIKSCLKFLSQNERETRAFFFCKIVKKFTVALVKASPFEISRGPIR